MADRKARIERLRRRQAKLRKAQVLLDRRYQRLSDRRGRMIMINNTVERRLSDLNHKSDKWFQRLRKYQDRIKKYNTQMNKAKGTIEKAKLRLRTLANKIMLKACKIILTMLRKFKGDLKRDLIELNTYQKAADASLKEWEACEAKMKKLQQVQNRLLAQDLEIIKTLDELDADTDMLSDEDHKKWKALMDKKNAIHDQLNKVLDQQYELKKKLHSISEKIAILENSAKQTNKEELIKQRKLFHDILNTYKKASKERDKLLKQIADLEEKATRYVNVKARYEVETDEVKEAAKHLTNRVRQISR